MILCGGLGPTEDDLTRDAVAAALDRKLIYHPEISDSAGAALRAASKRKMAEVNKRQAFMIEGAEILPNDRGTAPGQWIEDSGACVMLLPGPPHEMKAMFTRQCLPRLTRIVPRQAIRTLVLRVAGMPESDLDQTHRAGLQKVRQSGDHDPGGGGRYSDSPARALRDRSARPRRCWRKWADRSKLLLGDRIYSRNGQPLEEVVGDMLRDRHNTLSVAESATGGCWASASRRCRAVRTTSWADSSLTPTA